MRKRIAEIMVIMLLTSMLMLAFNVQQAECSEPPETEWSQTYGGTNNDRAFSVVQTSDGGYALAGDTSSFGAGSLDFWLVKTDSDGYMEWNRTYGGTNDDGAYCVIQTSDGGYAIAGWTGAFNGPSDFWLVLTDSGGNMQWNKTYHNNHIDRCQCGGVTIDGGYALAGMTGPSGLYRDAWFIKTDSNGTVQWDETYGGAGTCNDFMNSLVQTSDGGYVVAGMSECFDGVPGAGAVWLVRIGSAGSMLWHKTYAFPHSTAYSLVQTTDGGYAMACLIGHTPRGEDVLVIKTDADGNMEWNKTYGGEDNSRGHSIVQTNDGGYAVAGYTESFDAGGSDGWLIKLAGPREPFQSPAIWLYNFDQYNLNTLVHNLDSKGFKTVWLSTNTTKLDEESYAGNVSSFIGKAKEKGIFVHAMILEDPHTLEPNEHFDALQDVDKILTYNSQNPNETFDGIHIDVEPETHPKWNKTNWENNNNIMAMYIELLSEIHQTLRTTSMMFSAAHGWFYQEKADEFPDQFPNGQTAQFGQYLDAIVLMVYGSPNSSSLLNVSSSWDTTAEIVERANDEIEEADGSGDVHVIVGLGVQEFWKYSWLNDCIIQLDEELKAHLSYKGVSIFKYKSFSEINTWEYRIEDRYRNDTVLMVNTTGKLFKFSTPEKEFSIKEATFMLRIRGRIIIYCKDEEIIMGGLIIDRWWLGLCFATVKDLQTDNEYSLMDVFWRFGR